MKADRKLSKTRGPGVVVAECKSREEKVANMKETMKVKKEPAESRNFKDTITLDKPRKQRVVASKEDDC